jgi:hypothetical protein
VIEDYFHFKGKKYTETMRTLSQVTTDANGAAEDALRHSGRLRRRPRDLRARRQHHARAGRLEVGQTFEMSPKDGPVGTPSSCA